MSISRYNLNFITDEDLFSHVQSIVQQYSCSIDLKHFNKNIIDPIKLTFDKIIYSKNISELVDAEVIRQMDKSNNNTIGYFHQNIFNYLGGSQWVVPKQGFDVINLKQKIYVEMKNKHNTMNSSSSQKTYLRMATQLQREPDAVCMLVEVIAKKSQNIPWEIMVDGEKFISEGIRRVSIDKFYHLVTGEVDAFKQLCMVLPKVIQDVVNINHNIHLTNSVNSELMGISGDTLTGLYLLAFHHYEGFNDFSLDKLKL